MRGLLLKSLAVVALSAPALATERLAVLEVSGMNCPLCPITVRKVLERVPGVVEAKVDFASKRAEVKYDEKKVAPESLAKAVGDAGFPAKVK